jgi:hypothetical protein
MRAFSPEKSISFLRHRDPRRVSRLGRGAALALNGLLLTASVIAEALRITGHLRLAFAQKHIKEKEEGPTGSFYFLLGSFLTLAFFDARIATPVIIVLAVSDPIPRSWVAPWQDTPSGEVSRRDMRLPPVEHGHTRIFPLDLPRILLGTLVMTAADYSRQTPSMTT